MDLIRKAYTTSMMCTNIHLRLWMAVKRMISAQKWRAFLHDIGKPSVCTEDASGHRHFTGHATASEEIAKKILCRFEFSAEETRIILELVEYHGMNLLASEENVRAVMENSEEGFLQRWSKLRIADRNDHVYPKDAVFETDVEKILELAQNSQIVSKNNY